MVNIAEIAENLHRLTFEHAPPAYVDRLQGSASANLAKKLLDLTRCNGYEIIQTNGQRVYAPPASRNIPKPPRGCEIFIGKLCKNLYEDELVPVLERIGPLYKLRLMLDFTEKTRGYAFATYFSQADANRAVAELHNHEIRPGLAIAVYKSVDNCRLFIGNIPPEATRLDMLQLVARYAEGVRGVVMYQQYDQPELNRGFAFVEFESHRAAAMARRQFAPENLIAWGRRLYVDWADPLPEVEPEVMAKVTVLYLRNLPLDYTPHEVQNLVCNLVGAQIVRKVYKMHNFAFVHFYDRRTAEFALQRLQNLFLGNLKVDVEWARPREYSRRNRLNSEPSNFCTSVPPFMRRIVHEHANKQNARRRSKNNSFSSYEPYFEEPSTSFGSTQSDSSDNLEVSPFPERFYLTQNMQWKHPLFYTSLA